MPGKFPESDEEFEWLDRAYAQRDRGLIETKVGPLLKSLHNGPRYAAFLKKLNLPTSDMWPVEAWTDRPRPLGCIRVRWVRCVARCVFSVAFLSAFRGDPGSGRFLHVL